MPAPLAILRKDSKIFSHVRQKWLDETPEENVRQHYLLTLINEYGYTLEQIAEEVTLPGPRGGGNARADLVLWRTAQEKRDGKTALIVVECKADNVAINHATYEQGANYANNERAKTAAQAALTTAFQTLGHPSKPLLLPVQTTTTP